jgi:hypothetical protein
MKKDRNKQNNSNNYTNSKQIKCEENNECKYLRNLILNNFLLWEEQLDSKLGELRELTLNELRYRLKIEEEKKKEMKENIEKLTNNIRTFEGKKNMINGLIQAEENKLIEKRKSLIKYQHLLRERNAKKGTLDQEIQDEKNKLVIKKHELNQIDLIKNEKENVYNKNTTIIKGIIGKTLCIKPYFHPICIIRNNIQFISIDKYRKLITILDNDINSQHIGHTLNFSYIISTINNNHINSDISQKELTYIKNEINSLFEEIINNEINFINIIYYSYYLSNIEVIETLVKQLQQKHNFIINIVGICNEENGFENIDNINYENEYKCIMYTLSTNSKLKIFITCLFKHEIKELSHFRQILQDLINHNKKKTKSKTSYSISHNNNKSLINNIIDELIKCCGTSPFHSYFLLDLEENILLENIHILNTIADK